MKISIITETFLPSTDGIVTRLVASIRWLKSQGHDVSIIAPKLGVDDFEGSPVYGIPAFAFFFYRTKKFGAPIPLVKKYLQQIQPDVVHVVNPAVLGYAGVNYAKKLGFPLIASYHTDIPKYMDYYHLSFFKPLMWWHLRRLHNKADLNLCTSQTIKDQLDTKGFKNVNLWKRGVDLNSYNPNKKSADMRERLSNGHPDNKILLYVGRVAAEKEIEKVKQVLDADPNACLAIVGDGPYRSHLEEYFKGSNVVFTGFLHGEELASAFASSDIFVFSSTTETLGLVILEAMASGLPIVAAESGPTLEQIQDGKTGLLYNSAVKKDFQQKVLELINNDTLRKQIGSQARKESIELGWNKAAEQLLNVYSEVLKSTSSVPAKRQVI